MNATRSILTLLAAAIVLALGGCASDDAYKDDEEYSSMPWNTPQNWEAAPSIPGLSGPGH